MSDHMTIPEAAGRAKVSQMTVRRWIESGKLAATKSTSAGGGERWLIDPESLAALIENRSSANGPPAEGSTGESAAVLRERIAGLEALNAAKDEALADLRARLQSREEEARALIATNAQLTAKALPAPSRPGFWARFRREKP